MTEHIDIGDRGTALDRRDVLRGLGAAGVGSVGLAATSDPAAAGTLTGGCLVDWPGPVDARIDIDEDDPIEDGPIPEGGDLVIYVHGLFGEDVVDGIDEFNGLNQATALEMALTEQAVDVPVVAGMWDSTANWWTAKSRADDAGETLAAWLTANRDDYDSVVVVGHSLGGRVTLVALEELADTETTITSAGLFGAGVNPDTVCGEYADGIGASVEEGVYSYHSENDSIVCWVYAVAELTPALGCAGSNCDSLPDGFADIDVTDTVENHCGYLLPDSIGEGGSALPELVDNQFGFATPPDTGTLAGTVEGDGEGLAGADVTLFNPEEGSAIASATTNEAGEYAVEVVTGTYEVVVEEPGFEPHVTTVTVSDGDPTHLDIELEPDVTELFGVVAGTVTGNSGPVAGAPVEVLDHESEETVASITTDPDGNYEVQVYVGDDEGVYEVHADAPTHQPIVALVTVEGGETAVHDIDLDPNPGVLTGQVHADGDPVAGATLQVEDITAAELVETGTTDDEGTYTVELPPGAYEVNAEAEGFDSASGAETVTAGATTALDIELPVPELPPVVGENPPGDLNGDGLHRDVDGDGEFTIFDVQALFDNLDSDPVQSNPEAFDFGGDGDDPDIFDVQALFGDLQQRDELGLGSDGRR